MNLSAWLPWTFFAPLAAMLIANILYLITQWEWAAWVAIISCALCVLVLLIAAVPNWIRILRMKK